MIHRHLLTALHAALNTYLDLANENTTLTALDAISIDVDSTRRTLAQLRASPPQLQVHAKAGTFQPPLITAQQLSRNVTNRPLGHTSLGEESVISRQQARVEVIARTDEEVELLADLVMRSLQQARHDFIKNGYLYYQIEGLDELAPVEQLAAEELGIFIRRLTVSAMIQEDVARIYSAPTLGTLTLGLSPTGRVDIVSPSEL